MHEILKFEILSSEKHFCHWEIFEILLRVRGLDPCLSLLYTQGKSVNLIISPYGYVYISTYLIYMFICAVFWCDLWFWPSPGTLTHVHTHIDTYVSTHIHINLTRILPKALQRTWRRVLDKIINWSVLSRCRMRKELEMNARHQRYSEISCLIEAWTPTRDWKLHTFQAPMELWRKSEIPPTKHSLRFAPIESGDRFVLVVSSKVQYL